MKNYVIIGASTGIGRAAALQLANEGHAVYGTFNRHQPTESIPNVHYQQLDVMAETWDMQGLPTEIHGLVYCPGAIQLKPVTRIKTTEMLEDFQLQVLGAVKAIQYLMPQMKHSEPVSVVLFSTVAVQTGFTFHTQVAASKGAIEGITRALAAELAPRIRVNCIAPSIMDTPLAASLLSTAEKKEAHAQRHPLKKIGDPQDAAHLTAFLLSEKSAWMTGQILHLDGGMSNLK